MTFDEYNTGYEDACKEHLPEGMEHCTITFHQCAKGHAWLSATNWIQHGCPTCQLEQFESKSFENYILEEFKNNLELAREELQLNYEDDDIECRAWRFATEWTQDEIANQVGRILGRKWDEKQDSINKAFYE